MLYRRYFRLSVLAPIVLLTPAIIQGLIHILSGEADKKIINYTLTYCVACILFVLVAAFGKQPSFTFGITLTIAAFCVIPLQGLWNSWIGLCTATAAFVSFGLVIWFYIAAIDRMNTDTGVSHLAS